MRTWAPLLGTCSLLVLTAVGTGSAAATGTDEGLDLIGTWFVLIHYRDSATNNPDADRWEDRVWVFERSGSRIKWTDYPIVFFQDRSGRFEARAGNPRARTLERWEPNEGQLDEIRNGPRVNTRGSKSKTLRGSAKRGYESAGASQARSAMTVGYHETWKIESLTALPVFSRRDVMGSGLTQSAGGGLDGLTRYETIEVPNANLLQGSFTRDDSRRGDFRMMRTAAARGLPASDKSPNEKMWERARKELEEDVVRRAQEGDPEAIEMIEEYMREQEQSED
jgi:hypothetical protein